MPFRSIPTYSTLTNSWSHTEFEFRADFVKYLWSLFKEPGEYEFDESVHHFNRQARKFTQQGYFCEYPTRSRDFISYWDGEKEKCRVGVIIDNGTTQWYLPRDYYMWVNFLPIYHKEKKLFLVPEIRDVQYHMALYEEIAECVFKHCAILKKRQIASSYFHAAKMLNRFWFEEGFVNKMAGTLKTYINAEGTWRFLEEYRNFLNEHTAWTRACTPDKVLNWQQQVETKVNGVKIMKGLRSVLIGLVLDKDVTNGVGGPCLLKGSKVLTYNGLETAVDDVKIGDFVLGADGTPKKVTKLFHGSTDMYRVDQSKGQSYTVTADHTLYVWNQDEQAHRKILAKDFAGLSPTGRLCKMKGVKFDGLQSPSADLAVDPYYLGIYLGDGCKYDYSILVNKDKDPEIAEAIEEYATRVDQRVATKHKNKYRADYQNQMWEMRIGPGSGCVPEKRAGSITKKLCELGVEKKYIPLCYLQGSQEQRLQLLAGILDTDGYLNHKKNRFELTLHHDVLAHDVQRLCRLSGLDAHMHLVVHDNNMSTIGAKETVGWRINITGNLLCIPTKVARKKVRTLGAKNQHRYSTLQVTPVGKGEYFGFSCEDNLFVLPDGTITHNCGLFFHEEAGIAPKMNKTLEFLLPALKSGLEYTGMFVVAGSVGELDQCEPLRDLMFNPASKDVLAVRTNLLDAKGSIGECALFIPEQWSMPPYIDQFGNSIIHTPKPNQIEQLRKNWIAAGKDISLFDPTVGALQAIHTDRAQAKKDKSAADYQLYVSQHPINIEEAFAARTKSIFPLHLVGGQIDRIKAKEYDLSYKDIVRGPKTGVPEWRETKRLPIDKFPFNAAAQDKEGAIVVHEEYIKGSSFGTYVASIDPVRDGKSTTSDSLCSIYIYKNDVEVSIKQADETYKQSLEPGKLVAWWCGRFNDINDTHERCELMLEMYNAKAIIENNVTGFITHMIQRHKQKFMIRADELLFLKEMGANQSVFQDYGWRNTGLTFKLKMLPYAASVMSEELDRSLDDEGNTIVTKYGIERFPDIMLFEEVKAYREGLNVDRLISFAALMSYVKIQRANRAGEFIRREEVAHKLDNRPKSPILKERSPFRHMGQPTFDPVTMSTKPSKTRSPFRNIR